MMTGEHHTSKKYEGCFWVLIYIVGFIMRYIAAYMLAVLGGNENPTKVDVTDILNAGGLTVDQENLDRVYGQLSGKSLDDLIAAGQKKFVSMPSGGGGAAPAASSGAAPAKVEAKKEEKKEEPEEDGGVCYLFVCSFSYFS